MTSRVVDLTLTLRAEGMSVIAGNQGMELHALRTHQIDGRSSQRIEMSLHLGTHVDAPYHFDPNGEKIEQLDLTALWGEGVCLDLKNATTRNVGLPEDFSPNQIAGKIVLLSTGWSDEMFGKGRYYEEGPYLSEAAARVLVNARPKAIGADFPVDTHAHVAEQASFACHKLILTSGIPLIDNLTNLSELIGQPFTFAALPLRLEGGDGSPTRAVAMIESTTS